MSDTVVADVSESTVRTEEGSEEAVRLSRSVRYYYRHKEEIRARYNSDPEVVRKREEREAHKAAKEEEARVRKAAKEERIRLKAAAAARITPASKK